MNQAKLGVCIIGCGFMGNIHAARWQQVPQAKIVAVVDILEDRAQHFADLYNLPRYYTDYREAVGLPEVDVVSVCVPTYLHAEMTIHCAEQGKNILCEKPIALNLDQAHSMIRSGSDHPVRLGIGFMRRHSPVMEMLREKLASGEIARPVIYTSNDIRQVRPKLAMHDTQQNGGPVIDMAVHLIDTWRYIFQSKVSHVFAQGLILAKERPELDSIPDKAVDSAIITVTFASGDIGNFIVSWGLPPGVNPPGSPEHIYAPNGLAEISWSNQHQHLKWMVEGGEWLTLFESEEDLYQKEISAMATSILHGVDFPATAQDGVEALRIALAALQSINCGKAVYLS